MTLTWSLIIVVGALLLAPLVGGVLRGLDRKLTARLQGRMGPPLAQPFYDFGKLVGKSHSVSSRASVAWAWAYFLLTLTAFTLFFLGQDLLVVFFILAFAGGALAFGAFSTRSPYARLGANRELLQMLAYEPILLLAAVAIYFQTGKFTVHSVLEAGEPLLLYLPLVFVAVLVALGIKMRKSPFDIAASEHAHQELVRGVYTEYSGRHLALIEIAHWYELVLLLAFIALFWAQPLWVGVLIALGAFFLEIWIDNIAARLRWSWMVGASWGVGITFIVANLVLLSVLA
ncbi:MAG: complex I subunit 1 family protein [Eubacteriales bacterium]|nr:NADH-quinone oxidoreductase subunit H [Bacillota bacterium]MBV1726916.1 NADH-quinone oxidoreductase subunit H [Desulforudis sp.]MDP3051155.1 NADH-quinone oxidoreductase subunit H [Eubacteriales bacterium]MBU4533959.1 NADH-quinone oxidoreductase subunit H [Bacillota bacterium]MBU4554308.1 NADH-quinone oxidoreductase subunit H [Bacillota bacterium]